MIRSLWISLCLLGLLFGLVILDVILIERRLDEMENALDSLSTADVFSATQPTEALEGCFEGCRLLLAVSVPMDDIDMMKNSLIFLKDAIRAKDEAAYRNALSSLEYALYRLRDGAIPSLEAVL
jgi:hypothetical protein